MQCKFESIKMMKVTWNAGIEGGGWSGRGEGPDRAVGLDPSAVFRNLAFILEAVEEPSR